MTPLNKLYTIAEPSDKESFILNLARQIEKEKDPDYVSVSWESQVEALREYNSLQMELNSICLRKTMRRILGLKDSI